MTEHEDHTVSIRSEQAVLGALLADNDALDRIANLGGEHFWRRDHQIIFTEIVRQIIGGKRADAITVHEALKDKVEDSLKYLAMMRQSSVSAANILQHAAIVVEKAEKRALVGISDEMRELAASHESAATCIDRVASRLEALSRKKTTKDAVRMSAMLSDYADVLNQRMEGLIKPISTGHQHVDEMLDGGLERGTLTVVAGRPGMGKTAFGLGVARNVSSFGSSLFFSMEMSKNQVNDRNVAALGSIPIKWLRMPTAEDTIYWNCMTRAFTKSQEMNLFIDDTTGLNMLEIRAKARKVKREHGLDLVVVDQLSFITGGISEKTYEVVGEYTRALVALSKELDCAVMLLCQLNRECEKRPNKRPQLADIASSGSIEQDAANVIFLYRDEVYTKEMCREKGICEVISAKQRQGDPGTVGLEYKGSMTRFDDLPYRWAPKVTEDRRENTDRRGFT